MRTIYVNGKRIDLQDKWIRITKNCETSNLASQAGIDISLHIGNLITIEDHSYIPDGSYYVTQHQLIERSTTDLTVFVDLISAKDINEEYTNINWKSLRDCVISNIPYTAEPKEEKKKKIRKKK